jgi:hypothetical protein
MSNLKMCDCGERTYSYKCSLCIADEGLFSKPQPKREWVGLTEQKRIEIAGGELTRDERMIAIAIEAELKKLNT